MMIPIEQPELVALDGGPLEGAIFDARPSTVAVDLSDKTGGIARYVRVSPDVFAYQPTCDAPAIVEPVK